MLKPIAIAALIVTLDSVTASAQTPAAPAQTAAVPANTRAETVEQRIASLHTALKITPDEETKWDGVAQAIIDEAERLARPPAANRATGWPAPPPACAWPPLSCSSGHVRDGHDGLG
jgi:protein CpxP